jgi:ribosomal protein S18 acetylase RimI-like enzyme
MDRTYRYDLRPAERARDLTRMLEIERACFPEELAYLRGELYHFLRAKNAQTVVAVDRETGKTAGFVIVSWRSGCRVGYVQTLDVDPAEQGNGLGKLLLETAERIMAERGFRRSVLQVYLRNNTALVLYLKAGYTIRRVRARYYQNPYRGARDAIEMVKPLAPLPPTRLTVPEVVPVPVAPAMVPTPVAPAPMPAAALSAATGVPAVPITQPPGLDTPLPPTPAVPLLGTAPGAH